MPRNAALVHALCGDHAAAESYVRQLESRPEAKSTALGSVLLPVSRALIELGRGWPAEAQQELKLARELEMSQIADFWPTYVSGLSYLQEGAAADARAAFERILARRSVAPHSPLYPLAMLGAARAAALQGDVGSARTHYETLLTLWKEADTSLPVVRQAMHEYQRLR